MLSIILFLTSKGNLAFSSIKSISVLFKDLYWSNFPIFYIEIAGLKSCNLCNSLIEVIGKLIYSCSDWTRESLSSVSFSELCFQTGDFMDLFVLTTVTEVSHWGGVEGPYSITTMTLSMSFSMMLSRRETLKFEAGRDSYFSSVADSRLFPMLCLWELLLYPKLSLLDPMRLSLFVLETNLFIVV